MKQPQPGTGVVLTDEQAAQTFPGVRDAISSEEANRLIEEGNGGLIHMNVETKGGGSWAPFLDTSVDYTQWGEWEAWEFLAFGELPDGSVGARPTGDWIAWNRETGQQMGFTPKSRMTAREQAVMFCNMQNGTLLPTDEQLRTWVDPAFKGERSNPSEWKVNPLAKPTREVVSFSAHR